MPISAYVNVEKSGRSCPHQLGASPQFDLPTQRKALGGFGCVSGSDLMRKFAGSVRDLTESLRHAHYRRRAKCRAGSDEMTEVHTRVGDAKPLSYGPSWACVPNGRSRWKVSQLAGCMAGAPRRHSNPVACSDARGTDELHPPRSSPFLRWMELDSQSTTSSSTSTRQSRFNSWRRRRVDSICAAGERRPKRADGSIVCRVWRCAPARGSAAILLRATHH
jgi:hypothetical protein